MKKEEELNSIVNSSTMLITFEGWIKYIEGFSRGLQTTKTVDAITVFDCIGEIMEYMKSLKSQLIQLLTHCEQVLESEEIIEIKINEQEEKIKQLMEENNNYSQRIETLEKENEELKQAVILLGEKNGKNM